MNTFKRELILLKRSKTPLFLIPLFFLIQGLWLIFGIKVINTNSFVLENTYTLFPIFFSVIIPLFSYNIWQREIHNGLDKALMHSSTSVERILLEKFLFYTLFLSVIFILYLPIIFIFSNLTFIDKGQLFSINLGLFVQVLLYLSISMFLSLIIRNRILNVIISSVVLILISIFNINNGSFSSGLIPLFSIFIRLSASLLFFLLSLFIILKKRVVRLFIALILVLGSVYIPGTLDLTNLKSYTISDYSKSTINMLNSTLKIKYYFSEALVIETDIVNNTLNLLKQFDKLDTVTPEIYSDANIDSFKDGLIKYQADNIGVTDKYNFIVIEYNGLVKVIPSIPLFQTLEFEIIKVINYLKSNSLPSIAIFLGDDSYSIDNFNGLKTQLEANFHIDFYKTGDYIADSTDALLIIGQYDFTHEDIHEIEYFISLGKPLFFAINGLSLNDGLKYKNSELLNLLDKAGIEVEPYLIGSNNSIDIAEDDGSVTKYPLNIISYVNRESKYSDLFCSYPNFTGLHTSPVKTTSDSLDPILLSSKQSWLVDSATGMDGVPETDYSVALIGYSSFFSGINNRVVILGNSLSLTDYSNDFDFVVRSMYFLLDEDELLKVRHKFFWNHSLYKIERVLYRTSILNGLKLFLIIYPILSLLLLSIVFNIISILFRIRFKS